MHPYIDPIAQQFSKNGDATKAAAMKAYLLDQFPFHGLPTPERRSLCKMHYKTFPLTHLKELESIVKTCFHLDEREYQYFGIELFAFHKKLWKPSSIKLMEYCLTHKSWWDSVDAMGSEWLGPYFKMFPEQIATVTLRWNRSANIWLQRSSILFQKSFKKETDTALLSEYILHCMGSQEFFIRKAIGWSLREYAKTDPAWVKKFVNAHPLSPLSKREALKHL